MSGSPSFQKKVFHLRSRGPGPFTLRSAFQTALNRLIFISLNCSVPTKHDTAEGDGTGKKPPGYAVYSAEDIFDAETNNLAIIEVRSI